jgi:hypothetical protein
MSQIKFMCTQNVVYGVVRIIERERDRGWKINKMINWKVAEKGKEQFA